jgi:hypothetical protein
MAAVLVRAQTESCEICGGYSGAVAGFFQYFGFPGYPFRRLLRSHLHGGGTIGQIAGDIPNGLRVTPCQVNSREVSCNDMVQPFLRRKNYAEKL